VKINIVPGKVTEVEADAIAKLICPLEAEEKNQDQIDLDIWQIAGDYYRNRVLEKLGKAKDGEIIFVEGEKDQVGPFKDVIYIIDHGDLALKELVYDALTAAQGNGCQRLAMPVFWRNVSTLKEIADQMCTAMRRFHHEFGDSKMVITIAVGNDPVAFKLLNEYRHH
jgi:hypothetical protein